MTVLVGLVGVLLGAVAGAVTTYLTTRSNMLLDLDHAYDRTLRDKRPADVVVELATEEFPDWHRPVGRPRKLTLVQALRLTLCRPRTDLLPGAGEVGTSCSCSTRVAAAL